MNQKDQQAFEAWLCREMPAGTVISDPKWWAPKIISALARRDAQAAPVQEPVAYRAWFDEDNGARWLFTLWPDEEQLTVDWQPLYTAPPTAPVQQEPVAKIVSSGDYNFPLLQWISADHSFRAPIGSLLYAHPPTPPDVAELVEALRNAKRTARLMQDQNGYEVVCIEPHYWKSICALAKHGGAA